MDQPDQAEQAEREYGIVTKKTGLAGKLAAAFIDARITALIVIASLILGVGAIFMLPREEEPQIIVPMIDIFVEAPGQSAEEVASRVTRPMEKLLGEVPGVECIYSTSAPGMSMAIVRFFVGEDEEEAIVRLQSKLLANSDRVPPGISPPLIKPRYIDDVPILALTFWSKEEDHYALRRVAAEVENLIKREQDVSITEVIGGYRRQLQVRIDPARLAAHGLDPLALQQMLGANNQEQCLGCFQSGGEQIQLRSNGFLRDAVDAANLVVGVSQGRPIYLRDVAEAVDGPEEPENYVFFGAGPAGEEKGLHFEDGGYENNPAVTLTVAKRKGTNAITVAGRVIESVEAAKGRMVPGNIDVTVTRHYGETAQEKSNELLYHMMIAIVSVAIVVVENMVRHFRLPGNRGRPFNEIAIEAVTEVGDPTILATLTVIAAILPMAFVGGLMGPPSTDCPPCKSTRPCPWSSAKPPPGSSTSRTSRRTWTSACACPSPKNPTSNGSSPSSSRTAP